MKRFVFAGLSVLLAAAAIAPAVQAKSPNNNDALTDITLQQRRLDALDQRTKSNDSLTDTSLQQRRLHELNIRTKSSASLVDTSIQQYRLDALDVRDKS